MIRVGQAILGKIPFKDGTQPEYNRPYLVVSVSNGEMGVLVVSSLAGKEHKLAYQENRKITHYNPPFRKSSFVKLDSLSYIAANEVSDFRILSNGASLNEEELRQIVQALDFQR